MKQAELFVESRLPDGMRYTRELISSAAEAELLEHIRALPLTEAKYQQYTARRRTISFGAGYDFSYRHTTPAPSLPSVFFALRAQAAEFAGLAPDAFVQCLISEYQVGTPLGWHRDVPDYEVIVGISLAGWARLRLRPYPWTPDRKREILAIDLEPRSAYVLRGPARWDWQHQVPPTKMLRYSITFRSLRQREHS